MKKAILSASALAMLLGCTFGVMTAWGQNNGAKASKNANIALIDMAEVFKKYEKFAVLRDGLKAEIEKTDLEAQQRGKEITGLQAQMKEVKPGSPDFIEMESQLAQLTTEFETFRKVKQRDFLRQEAALYHTIYLEVTEWVGKYAEHYEYTMVLRFNREELATDDPQQLIQGMNRQVVYFRANDDITDQVITLLNKQYEKEVNPPARKK
ncbi:MAG: OmpH family outer membrane protein [Planctomycetota bacterium]|nr:OmpH family outer membrane protein [Planctomycetota bacterium]MDA1211757.1 OmpH family outer membrane protein [Planctomycetota bacterium]